MLPNVNLISRRRQLVFAANTAQTPEQIKAAREAVANWLRRHPEDEIIKRTGRQLERSEDRLRESGKWH